MQEAETNDFLVDVGNGLVPYSTLNRKDKIKFKLAEQKVKTQTRKGRLRRPPTDNEVSGLGEIAQPTGAMKPIQGLTRLTKKSG